MGVPLRNGRGAFMVSIRLEDYLAGKRPNMEAIGMHILPDKVILFMPGDESTPEWQALHPPYESQEDESLNT